MKHLLFVILSVILCIPMSLAAEQAPISDILNTSRAGVVKINVRGVTGEPGQEVDYTNHGSGFVLTPDGYVETSAHLMPSQVRDMVVTGRLAYDNVDDQHPEHDTPLKIVAIDYGIDGAPLKFDSIPKGMRALPSNPMIPLAGEPLYVLGFPGGQDNMTRDDVVSQAPNRYITNDRFEYHGIANPGNSGGPIFDKDGSVVGIVANDIGSIEGTAVVGIHQAVPVIALPFPDDFDSELIRPLFVPTSLFHFTFDDENLPGWSRERETQEEEQFIAGPHGTGCGLTLNMDWTIHNSPNGFHISPPAGTTLARSQFVFAQVVTKSARYQNDEARDSTDDWIHVPFRFVPHSNESIVLFRMLTADYDGRQSDDLVPFILTVTSDKYSLGKFAPRYYSFSDKSGEADQDTFLAYCSVKKSLFSLRPFLNICESLMKQTFQDYYIKDNECVPGSHTN